MDSTAKRPWASPKNLSVGANRGQRRLPNTRTTSTGVECDSGFEREVVQSLIDRGVEFECQPASLSYRTRVRSAICSACGSEDAYQRRKYTPDLRLADGSYVEIKGHLKPQNRSFLKQVLVCNPDVRLRFVFQRNNIYGKTRTRYSDWAKSLGCESSVGSLPSAWTDVQSSNEGGLQCKEVSSTSLTPTSVASVTAPATTRKAVLKSSRIRKLRSIIPKHKAAVAGSASGSGE